MSQRSLFSVSSGRSELIVDWIHEVKHDGYRLIVARHEMAQESQMMQGEYSRLQRLAQPLAPEVIEPIR
jgi:hypothetical protein